MKTVTSSPSGGTKRGTMLIRCVILVAIIAVLLVPSFSSLENFKVQSFLPSFGDSSNGNNTASDKNGNTNSITTTTASDIETDEPAAAPLPQAVAIKNDKQFVPKDLDAYNR